MLARITIGGIAALLLVCGAAGVARDMHERATICGGFNPANRAACELAYEGGGAHDARLIAQGMREDGQR